MIKDRVKVSKFLSFILRHGPQDFGLSLDENGFADFNLLFEVLKKRFAGLEREDVESIIDNDPKKRFQMSGKKIRARYGHSVEVQPLEKCESVPDILFHGTSPNSLDSILKEGLKPGRRRFVHLSITKEEALKVGSRKDPNPSILKIDAGRAQKDGLLFWKEADIYLSREMPPQYLSVFK